MTQQEYNTALQKILDDYDKDVDISRLDYLRERDRLYRLSREAINELDQKRVKEDRRDSRIGI